MKKTTKTAALLLAFVLVLGALASCGPKFDAAAYVRVTLDSNFKGITTDIDKYVETTEEDAKKDYEEIMEAWGTDMLNDFSDNLGLGSPSDEMKAKYIQFMKDVYAKTRYTVGTATADGDGFIVPVTCEPLTLFSDALFTNLESAAENWATTIDPSADTDALMDSFLQMVLDVFQEALDNATYGEATVVEVHVVLEDKLYNIPDDDYTALDEALVPGE